MLDFLFQMMPTINQKMAQLNTEEYFEAMEAEKIMLEDIPDKDDPIIENAITKTLHHIREAS
jgi:hypothetical protein